VDRYLVKNIVERTTISFGEQNNPGYIKYTFDSKGDVVAVSFGEFSIIKNT
jgi:hypothetical protein